MLQFPNITLAILPKEEASDLGREWKGLTYRKSQLSPERIAQSISHLFSETIIISNNQAEFKPLGFQVYPTKYRSKTPLCGIQSALEHAKGNAVFVVSHDAPNANASNANKLASIFVMKSVAVLVSMANGKAEPLFAIYSKQLLPLLNELLQKSKNLSLNDFIERVNPHFVEITDNEFSSSCYQSFNTPYILEDLNRNKKNKKQKGKGDWFA